MIGAALAILIGAGCAYFFWHLKKIGQSEAKLDQLFNSELSKLNIAPTAYSILQMNEGMQKNSRGSVYWSRNVLIQTNMDEYISMILTSDESSKYVQYISELRARRALFNKPKEYLAAFGESPDRKQLARLMGEVNE